MGGNSLGPLQGNVQFSDPNSNSPFSLLFRKVYENMSQIAIIIGISSIPSKL